MPSVALLSLIKEFSPSLVLLLSNSQLGVVVTKRALSGMVLLPRLVSLPKHGIVIAERVLSGVALLPSNVASSPERGVVVIIAAINNGGTTKRCFMGVGSVNRGDSKREQVPPRRQ